MIPGFAKDNAASKDKHSDFSASSHDGPETACIFFTADSGAILHYAKAVQAAFRFVITIRFPVLFSIDSFLVRCRRRKYQNCILPSSRGFICNQLIPFSMGQKQNTDVLMCKKAAWYPTLQVRLFFVSADQLFDCDQQRKTEKRLFSLLLSGIIRMRWFYANVKHVFRYHYQDVKRSRRKT